MIDQNVNEDAKNEEAEARYESTPEELTAFKGKGGPPWFDRKKVLMALCFVFAGVVIVGVIVSTSRSNQKQAEPSSGYAANVPRDFLQRELERSLSSPPIAPVQERFEEEPGTSEIDRWGLPIVSSVPVEPAAPPVVQYYPPPNQSAGTERQPQPQLSSLVPNVEGKLFASQASPQAPAAARPEQPQQYNPGFEMPNIDYSSLMGSVPSLGQPDPYATQNNQADKNAFYSSASGGAVSGFFLQDDLLWIGTIIPAVLETAINTDLPGNVIARVTQNIYDSRTGRKLLIPQGTLLVAQYNSSVSYAQRRVQIAWDILIRPDGYMVELEGMNGVDSKGMAGLKAVYRENWFEYVKAAGIISMFTLANGKMVEQVAKYGSDDMAAGVVSANAEFIEEIGGNLVSRALNIQPTLTIDNGEKISVMLNKSIYLPPVNDYQTTQRYILP
jgi:type IV secretory pathway VirB10-like protein